MTRHRLAHRDGFTLIETMIALVILIVGLLGTFALISTANSGSAGNRAREGATNLGREIAEQSRSVPFAQLTSASVVSELTKQPGLADDDAGTAGWQIVRRGFTFTVAPVVCAIDDPKDDLGDHSGAAFCPDSSAGASNVDGQPEDFKRVTVDVSFRQKSHTATVRVTSTLNSSGQAVGMTISSLRLTSPSPPSYGTATEPVIGPGSPNLLTFTATAPASATSVVWMLDGQTMAPAPVRQANGTDWTFTWDISNAARYTDGSYEVSVLAIDSLGAVGPARPITVRLARTVPAAPTGIVGGHNKVYKNDSLVDVAELQWLANRERNVEGYRVYVQGGTAPVCSTSTLDKNPTSCIDFGPQNFKYEVRAVYRNAAGTLTESASGTITIGPPQTTQGLGLRVNGGAPVNTANNCYTGIGARYDMVDGYLGADPAGSFSGSGAAILFCSAAYTNGEILKAGPLSFKANVSVGKGQKSCRLNAYWSVNGSNWSAAAFNDITPSTVGLRTWTWTVGSDVALPTGARLNLALQYATVSDCDKTALSYGGATEPGRFYPTVSAPNAVQPPAPTGLTAATQADGTVLVSWTAPANTANVGAYRIYKGGRDYTQRVDMTGSATDTTFTDLEPTSGASYYVTSVSPTLVESDFAGPVTP